MTFDNEFWHFASFHYFIGRSLSLFFYFYSSFFFSSPKEEEEDKVKNNNFIFITGPRRNEIIYLTLSWPHKWINKRFFFRQLFFCGFRAKETWRWKDIDKMIKRRKILWNVFRLNDERLTKLDIFSRLICLDETRLDFGICHDSHRAENWFSFYVFFFFLSLFEIYSSVWFVYKVSFVTARHRHANWDAGTKTWNLFTDQFLFRFYSHFCRSDVATKPRNRKMWLACVVQAKKKDISRRSHEGNGKFSSMNHDDRQQRKKENEILGPHRNAANSLNSVETHSQLTCVRTDTWRFAHSMFGHRNSQRWSTRRSAFASHSLTK